MRTRLGFCFVAVALYGISTVHAQTTDNGAMINRLNRLENEVQTLNQQVYRGAAPPAASAMGSGGIGSGNSSFNTMVDTRLSALEDQLQQLTNKTEENANAVNQMRIKNDKVLSDMQLRLSDLEAKTSGNVNSAIAAKPASQAAANAAPAAPALASTNGTLGTLSQSDAVKSPATAPTAKPANNDPQSQYDAAFDMLKKANYEGAQHALKDFLSQHGDSPLAASAQYWLGESYFARAQYSDAAVAFAEGYQKYPKGAKAPDSLLKLGISLGELKQKADACEALKQLNVQFPNDSASLKHRTQDEQAKLGCS